MVIYIMLGILLTINCYFLYKQNRQLNLLKRTFGRVAEELNTLSDSIGSFTGANLDDIPIAELIKEEVRRKQVMEDLLKPILEGLVDVVYVGVLKALAKAFKK